MNDTEKFLKEFTDYIQNYHLNNKQNGGGKSCPIDKMSKKSYITKKGTKVKATCIPKYGEREKRKQYIKQIEMKQKKAKKLFSNDIKKMKCKKNEILRSPSLVKSYLKKNNTKVKGSLRKPVCIKKKGAKTPTKTRIVILPNKNGDLKNFGYQNILKMNIKDRQNALKKAIIKKGHRYVIQHLTAIANLTHRTMPKFSERIKKDRDFVSNLYKKYKSHKNK